MGKQNENWHFSIATWVIVVIYVAFLVFGNSSSLENLLLRWNTQEAYSHGYFIPLVSLLFIWEKKHKFQAHPLQASWLGPAVLLVSLLVFVLAELTALYYLGQISFILSLLGLSLALVGIQGTRLTYIPICLLIFAIPIPGFLEATLTANLQLISSKLGVEFIRLCNIGVYREGNLIDLGTYKLEVAEACSGLTYLYPLLWFGCIFAYMYRASMWKRFLIIVSSIPIAILLNSIRIGAIGVLVNAYGNQMAEGFLHAFEGWVVFMVGVGILMTEIWLLNLIGSDRRPFAEVFGVDLQPADYGKGLASQERPLPRPLLAALLIAVAMLTVSSVVKERPELRPERALFSEFPMAIGEWQGKAAKLEPDVLEVLKLSDYLLADYTRGTGAEVNFYAAYYSSQRKGTAPHSPAVCMPGGGWQITEMDRRTLPPDAAIPGGEFPYNRVIIRNGEDAQLVYYWYQERGRRVASEYLAKWFLFQDALTMNRSDGALVRLVTPLGVGETEASADQRLAAFLKAMMPLLPKYVPD